MSKTIGERLRAWRVANKVAQQTLADHLRISPQLLNDIEFGRRYVSAVVAIKLQGALGWDASELMAEQSAAKLALAKKGMRLGTQKGGVKPYRRKKLSAPKELA